MRNILILALMLSALTLEGCRTAPPPKSPAKIGARPQIGPSLETSESLTGKAANDEDDMPPQPTPTQPKKVAVILGPGGGKSFAHVGVLKALQQQRIPIEKVVGLEWGALVGGLFAVKGSTHDVEWKLYKMEQRNLLEPKGFFSRRADENSLNVMDGFFNDVFGREEIEKARVSFACPSRSIWTGVVAWQTRGAFKDVMRRCMSFPPVFKPQGTFIAGASQASEAVEMLAKEGYNVIIFVNVLGSAMPVAQEALRDNLVYVILWQEIKRGMYEASRLNIDTINVDTSAVPITNFGSKKELISLGEAAGQKAASTLIHKYGF